MTTAGLRYLTPTLLLASWFAVTAVLAEEPLPAAEPAQPQLVWCLDHFSRFHHYEDVSEPYGPSVDLMRELARRANFKLAFTPRTTLARCFRLLADGQADLMSNLRYSPERDSIMFMLPYNKTMPESLFLRFDDQRQIDNTNQLRHLAIARIRGYLYSPAAMTYLQQHPRQIIDVDSIEAALEMVLRGRVDGVIAPTVSTTDAINNTAGYTHRFRKAGLDFDQNNASYIHIGLSRNSPHKALEPELRKHLNNMIKDGTIARLYEDVIRQPLLAPMPAPQH
jgi:polar amino acid transport system substrate-binding protein